jgi:hypothetical protein
MQLGLSRNEFTGAPTVSPSAVTCNLANLNIQYHFSTLCGWIADLLIPMAGDIEAMVCDAIVDAANNFTRFDMNQILSEFDLQKIPLPMDIPYDFMGVDASLTRDPSYSGGATPFLQAPMHANILNTLSTLPEMPRPPPSQVGITPGGRMMTAAVSSWTMETLLYVVHRAGMMNATVTKEMLPSPGDLLLISNGPTWLTVAPELFSRSPAVEMDVFAKSRGEPDADEGLPHISIEEGIIRLEAPIELIFRVASEPSPTPPSPPPPLPVCCPTWENCDVPCVCSINGAPTEGRFVRSMADCPGDDNMSTVSNVLRQLDEITAPEKPLWASANRRPQPAAAPHRPQQEELFALGCPLKLDVKLGVEAVDQVTLPVGRWPGVPTPTTRVTLEFSYASCEVELLRSSVGELNL